MGYLELSGTAKQLAKEHENGLITGLMNYYQNRTDAAERIGAIILFIGNLFVGFVFICSIIFAGNLPSSCGVL